jgi:hypothetical protein
MRDRGDDLHGRIRQKIAQTEKISKVFRKFDVDKDGFVSRVEFKEGLQGMGFDVSKKDVQQLMSSVDKDNSGIIDYVEFCKSMVDEAYESDTSKVDAAALNRKYAGAGFRDNIGTSMQVREDSHHIKIGNTRVGEGAMAGEARLQRDVGDRAVGDDQVIYQSHLRAGAAAMHGHDDKDFSTFEKCLKTPRYTAVNSDMASFRVASPGMSGVLNNSVYGDQTRVNMLLDPFGLDTVVEPMTQRRGIRNGQMKPCRSRNELFAKRRGENFKSLDSFEHDNFFGDTKLGRVYQFIKDKPAYQKLPGEHNRRMGDVRFDPDSGLDRVKYEKETLAKNARKKVRKAQLRYREALKGRGT